MKIGSILTFGRYKGRTIEEIWTGEIPITKNKVLKNYIIELCSFLLDNNSKIKIPASDFNLDWGKNETLFLYQSNAHREICFQNDKIILKAEDDLIPIAFFKILKNVLTGSFIGKERFYVKDQKEGKIEYSKNSLHFKFLQADPQYINWCINKIKDFKIEAVELEALISKPCKHLSYFEVSKVSDNVFTCKALFKEIVYELPAQTIVLNKEKFKEINTFYSNDYHHNQDEEESYCSSCHESPCMCSDREESSSIYDY